MKPDTFFLKYQFEPSSSTVFDCSESKLLLTQHCGNAERYFFEVFDSNLLSAFSIALSSYNFGYEMGTSQGGIKGNYLAHISEQLGT